MRSDILLPVILVFVIVLSAGWYFLVKTPAPDSTLDTGEPGTAVVEEIATTTSQHDSASSEGLVPPTAPAPVGDPIALRGTFLCMPPKDASKKALECRFGIRTEDGKYYGVDMTIPAQQRKMPSTNSEISIEGTTVEIEDAGGAEVWASYPISGIVKVLTLTKL